MVGAGIVAALSACMASDDPPADPSLSLAPELEAVLELGQDGSIADVRIDFTELELDWAGLARPVETILLGVDSEYGRLFETAYEGSWTTVDEHRVEPGIYSLLGRTAAAAEDLSDEDELMVDLTVVVQLLDESGENLVGASSDERLRPDPDEGAGSGSEESRYRVLISVISRVGERLEDVAVRIFDRGDDEELVDEAETGEDGRARFELPAGRYLVRVDPEDYQPGRAELDVDGEDEALVFMLGREEDDEGDEGEEVEGDEGEEDDEGDEGEEEDEGDDGEEDDEAEDEDEDEDDDDDGFIFRSSPTGADGHDGI